MHTPVLLKETLEALAPRPAGRYIDGTVGGGGHSEAILDASSPDSRLLGIDRDPDAVKRCRERLARFGDRFTCVHSDFASMASVASAHGFESVDGILLDLGVSSFQFDEPARGFSFMNDGPLDMRMDNSSGMTASQLLDSFQGDWRSFASLLREFGDESSASQIARTVLAEHAKSPIVTTSRLAEVIEEAVGGRRGAPRHPATRSFQALRIAVNRETEQVRDGLEAAISLLAEDGRLAVITFHSIEDRIAKQTFAAHEGRMVSLQQGGAQWEGREPAVARVSRRPITPSEDEISMNPRARSAKLRAVRRVQTPH
jgi:16S rRNA (cytosine1402-N4)-methyltransferase